MWYDTDSTLFQQTIANIVKYHLSQTYLLKSFTQSHHSELQLLIIPRVHTLLQVFAVKWICMNVKCISQDSINQLSASYHPTHSKVIAKMMVGQQGYYNIQCHSRIIRFLRRWGTWSGTVCFTERGNSTQDNGNLHLCQGNHKSLCCNNTNIKCCGCQ